MSETAACAPRFAAALMPLVMVVGLIVGCAGPAGSGPAGSGLAGSGPAGSTAGGAATPGASGGGPAAATTPAAGGTVATFTGKGGDPQNTGVFTVHGGHVHFVYTVQPNDVGPVPFLWSMYPQGAPLDPAHPRARDSCASCDGEQSDDLGVVPAGSYYLHVITSRPWKLAVAEG